MSLNAVLFDMDGVVVDSERHWRDAERRFLARHLPNAHALDQRALMGLSLEGFYVALRRDYGLALTLDGFREVYRRMAADIYEEHCALMPGFAPLAQAARADGLRVALVSSSPMAWIDKTLDRFGVRGAFELVVSADEVGGEGKPSPAVYLRSAERLALPPPACVAIEDSANGVRSAKSAGMACVALRNGFNDEQDFSAADLEVRSLEELTPGTLRSLRRN